jgi:PTS system mannose-specific IID component
MVGGGFAFAILPLLRMVYRGRPEAFHEALQRHSGHFNAHPYLANLALGAVCRMEEEGRGGEEIERFKGAVRGPLGGLGDALVWVGWRPALVLGSLVLALAGAPPAVTVAFFLLLYNLGHLTLRIWGFRVGLDRGVQVGDSLRTARLSRLARKLTRVAVFFLGGLVGLTLTWAWSELDLPLLLLALTGGVWGLWLGNLVGQRGWRWTYWAVSGALGVIFIVGWFA